MFKCLPFDKFTKRTITWEHKKTIKSIHEVNRCNQRRRNYFLNNEKQDIMQASL